MDEEIRDNDLGKWFSTYGFITAERILSKFSLVLPQDDLIDAINHPHCFYHQVLRIPLKNVLNGIVLQQAHDYHVYVQKLFIDYLLSGESGKDASLQGASTREDIEEERSKLLVMGEEFHLKQLEQDSIIASSQKALIDISKNWNTSFEIVLNSFNSSLKNSGIQVKKSLVRKLINQVVIHCDLSHPDELNTKKQFKELIEVRLEAAISDDLSNMLIDHLDQLITISNTFSESVSEFSKKNQDMSEVFRAFRTKFYDKILRVTSLIHLLPDYKIDPEQDKINREPLYFDKSI